MSWNINVIGKVADVKAAVLAEQYLPQSLKDAVAQFADAGVNTATGQNYAGLRVKTSGHYSPSDAWSSVSEFTIERLSFAPPAPPTGESK